MAGIKLRDFLTVTGVSAFAQSSATGCITGIVTDQNGAVVAGAAVTPNDKGFIKKSYAVSHDAGKYKSSHSGLGVYSLTMAAPGFKKAAECHVPLQLGEISTRNVALETGDVKETVKVAVGWGRLETGFADGLLRYACNITLDGMNIQENFLKPGVAISTVNSRLDDFCYGAVQVRFATQGGSNDFHGQDRSGQRLVDACSG